MSDLIPCAQKDDELLADIRGADVSRGFAVWWLGQSGFLVKTRGGVILFDPYLSDSLTKKYAGTDKPHVRMTERAIDPARLDMVDVVTSSHNHTDHLDAETIRALSYGTFLMPEANVAFAVAERGVNARRVRAAHDGNAGMIGRMQFFGTTAGATTKWSGMIQVTRNAWVSSPSSPAGASTTAATRSCTMASLSA